MASGRVGYVLLVNKKLFAWQLSRQAFQSPEEAARFAKQWVERFRPDVVVTEKITGRCRKGEKACSAIAAIAEVASNEAVYDLAVVRPKKFPNKYAEAVALADRFPDLRARLPQPRKLWDSEDRNTTIFEALALVLEVVDRGDLPHSLDSKVA